MIEPLLGNDYRVGHSLASICAGDGYQIWKHHKELRDIGVWPLASALKSWSIATVCGRLKGYRAAPEKSCTCSGCKIDFEQAVRKASCDALSSFDGLCLNCIKLGGSGSDASQKCQFHKPVDLKGSSSG